MTVPYGGIVDPLTLGTLYECVDENSGANNVSFKEIPNKDGGLLQANAAKRTYPLSAKYYMHSGATLLTSGTTVNAWTIDSCEPSKTAEGHAMMTVTGHKTVNVATVDLPVLTAP